MAEKKESTSSKSLKSSRNIKGPSQKTLFDHFTKKEKPAVEHGVEEKSIPDSGGIVQGKDTQEDLVEDEVRSNTEQQHRSGEQIQTSSWSSLVPLPREEIIEIESSQPLSSSPLALSQHTTEDEFDAMTGAVEGHSRNDPIVIYDSSPVRPKRVLSEKPKVLHPFFAPRTSRKTNIVSETPVISSQLTKSTNLSASPRILDAGRQHSPILIEPSSPPSLLPGPPSKPIHPFFSPRKKAGKRNTSSSPSKVQPSVDAPLPVNVNQHVRGPQNEYSASSSSFPPRTRGRGRSPAADTSFIPNYQSSLEQNTSTCVYLQTGNGSPAVPIRPRSSSEDSSYLNKIPQEHLLTNPVISHFLYDAGSMPPSQNDHRLWTDKWRPTRADHVLGNEENALYLRDWMRSLELTFETKSTASETDKGKRKRNLQEDARGVKRPRVVRAVSTKRGRKKRRVYSDDEDDGWITLTEGDFESEILGDEETEPLDACETDRDRPELPSTSLQPSRSCTPLAPPRHTFSELTNTILLTGPPGCGKTAAVYACAEELGYEVFEVYPGIGRRNGASLDNLVGEVGKNHLVGRGTNMQENGRGKNAFAALLQGKNSKDPLDVEESQFGFMESKHEGSSNALGVRQSLILLEEVDILFKDDANFWPAVITLIKECRRPVICTCNDISLVPISDLPLQTILSFGACPATVATSYLQVMCFTEGFDAERGFLEHIYEGTSQYDGPGDLRQAIHALQMGCGPQIWSGSWDHHCLVADKTEWKAGQAHATELVSFIDSYISRGDRHTEANTSSSADDELGRPILFDSVDQLGTDYVDDRYGVSIVSSLSRGAPEAMLTMHGQAMFLTRGHARVQALIGGVIPARILRPGELELEYLPYLRMMVTAEDSEERALFSLFSNVAKRTTRNSFLASHRRMIELSYNERKALEDSAFIEFNVT